MVAFKDNAEEPFIRHKGIHFQRVVTVPSKAKSSVLEGARSDGSHPALFCFK